MPRIVLNLTADSQARVFSDDHLARLATLGDVTPFDPKAGDASETFAPLLAHADVMLTCWGSRALTAGELAASGRDTNKPLLVAHSAGSVRGIMPKELLGPMVRLTQSADAVAVAVAHYTVGLLTLALRQSLARREDLRAGIKNNRNGVPYYDLEGITVGLIGLSRVGLQVARVLAPFHCKLVAYDPYCTQEKAAAAHVTLVADLDEMLGMCRAVSLHAPVTPETNNLLDARRVGLLLPHCALVNTARAQLVDQEAVFARAATGEIEYYADVTTPEPLPIGHEAFNSPHIFLTPHIAGPTQQTLGRMAQYAIDEIERFLTDAPLRYEVTAERYDLLA